jgi:hypothetical protein
MNRGLIIRMDPLPPRARALSAQSLSQVFGGCLVSHEACNIAVGGCCPGLRCQPASVAMEFYSGIMCE